MTLSPDGKRCAIRSDWATHLWDLGRRKPVIVKALPNFGPDYCTRFSPDGRLLAVGSWNNDIRIHDTQTGELLRTLKGHSALVYPLDFSADGKTLVSGGADRAIKLWDPYHGELRTTLRGHVGAVTTLSMSPDGRAIASYGADQRLRVWRTAAGAVGKSSLVGLGEQLRKRGNRHLSSGQYRKALDDYLRAADLFPKGSFNRHYASYRAAYLLIHFDRTDDYRQLCRRHIAENEQTDDIQIMERILKMCAFADVAQHKDVPPVLSRFAKHVAASFEREAKVAGIRHWIHQALGIAAYRTGNYTEARDWLRKSNALFEKNWNSTTKVSQTAANLYYLALAAHRAGRTEDARKRFAEATDKYASLSQEDLQRTLTDGMVLQRVRTEAEALFKKK